MRGNICLTPSHGQARGCEAWLRRRFDADGLLSAEFSWLAVDVDGQWAGRMTWMPVSYGPHSQCWRIAAVTAPAFRRRGVGTQAHLLLVDYLFAHTPAERVEALTDLDNVAEQLALTRSGFDQEGVVRRSMWRAGAWRDQLLYACLRSRE